MEEGQRLCRSRRLRTSPVTVLILVVMEEGQRLMRQVSLQVRQLSLNPCCNGRGSKTVPAAMLPTG